MKLCIVELRKFKQLNIVDDQGRPGHTIIKIKAPASFKIGTQSIVQEEEYNPLTTLSHIGESPKSGHWVYDVRTHCVDKEGQTQWVRISDDHQPTRRGEPNDGFLFVFKLSHI